tara:strand:+ start:382 stop:558 length:177 start_codon:yes stop_codon:yes gene_type:complete
MKEIMKELFERLERAKERYKNEKNIDIKKHYFGKFCGYESAIYELQQLLEDKEEKVWR